MNVLLIENEPAVVSRLVEVLTTAGYVLHCCSTSGAALEVAARIKTSLIISETNLAGVSGVMLCEHIKQTPGMEDVPVMFLSATQVPDVIRRTQPLGGAYYLRKPFEPEVLLELIDRALHMPHAARRCPGAVMPETTPHPVSA